MKSKSSLGRPFEPGQVISRQGEESGSIFVVQDGSVRSILETAYGYEELEVMGAGEIFGAVSVLTQSPSMATYLADKYARVMSIDRRLFMKRLHEDPSFAYNLLKELAEEIRFLRKEVENQAMYDSLTKAYSFRMFDLLLGKEIKRARRNKTPLSLCLMEIRNCSNIHKLHGYQACNNLIKSIADLLRKTIRENDILIRWSGAQLVTIMVETNITQARIGANRLRSIITSTTFDEQLTVDLNHGVAEYTEDSDQHDLLDRMLTDFNGALHDPAKPL